MTLPRWLARFNRKHLNPRALDRGTWPVLIHTGRKTGNRYRTPLDVHPVEDGYVFVLNYGSRSDWVRNVLADGKAWLELDGEKLSLSDPQVLPVDEGYRLLDPGAKTPPAWVGVEECLLMRSTARDDEVAGRSVG